MLQHHLSAVPTHTHLMYKSLLQLYINSSINTTTSLINKTHTIHSTLINLYNLQPPLHQLFFPKVLKLTSSPPPIQPVQSTTPPPPLSSVQLTSSPPPIQPVQPTPPITTIPDTQPTHPPSPQIPSPPYYETEGPSFEPLYHMSPPPSHEPEIQTSRTSEESEQLRNLLDLVPRLEINRVESLEKELSDTKQTLGTAVLQLIKKVTKLENKLRQKRNKLRQKRKREDTKDEEDAEADQLSPLLRGCTILNNVVLKDLGSQALLVARFTAGKPNLQQLYQAELNTGETERVQRREGKSPMTEEDLQAKFQASKKSKELQELADLEAAQRLQATMDAEAQRQIHLDALLARRLVEQEEEAAKEALATEFDYIQARLNAE
ncbi:hypothetical protein Tco_0969574 [Tanacetum coccineum]